MRNFGGSFRKFLAQGIKMHLNKVHDLGIHTFNCRKLNVPRKLK